MCVVWPARPTSPLLFYNMLRFILLAYKPQHIEWERGMGLAGQTSMCVVHVHLHIYLYSCIISLSGYRLKS